MIAPAVISADALSLIPFSISLVTENRCRIFDGRAELFVDTDGLNSSRADATIIERVWEATGRKTGEITNDAKRCIAHLRAGADHAGPTDDELTAAYDQANPKPERPPVRIVTADKLVAGAPELRPIIIDGLLRRGAVCNFIASPKTGKSWAVGNLAVALVRGGLWFGYKCSQGRTLLVDNELHRETLSSRLGKIANAYGMTITELGAHLDLLPLRGNLRNLDELAEIFTTIERGKYAVVIIDSLYRAIPPDIDENSNADITRLYNTLDRYAAAMDAAFIVIHHTSKGIQGGKAITDVGAGAGAQARAADSHITLRPHEESGVVVLDAVVRSFAPPLPSCWRFEVPTFYPAADLDPTVLQRERRPSRRKDKSGADAKPKAVPWTPERFAERFIGKDGKSMDRLKAEAAAENLTDRKAETLTRQAVAMEFAHSWPGKSGRNGYPVRYANIPCPVTEARE